MFKYLYDWLLDISYYLILVTSVTHVLPSGSYRKYIRFFTGLVLIMMLLTPVMNLFGRSEFVVEDLDAMFENMEKFQGVEEIQNDDMNSKMVEIEVEDIVIGP